MAYEEGDMLGDCPECGAKNSIVYKGGNEAFCKKCGVVFEVEDDRDDEVIMADVLESHAQQEQPEPDPELIQLAASPHRPNVVEPIIRRDSGDVTAFATPNVEINKPAVIGDHQSSKGPVKVGIVDEAKPNTNPGNQLDGSFLDDPDSELNLPDYLKSTRAWRWAHDLGNTGNPFSGASNSFKIYNTIVSRPCTIGAIPALFEKSYPDLCTRPAFLMSVYEVLSQCLTAGLLVMDPTTRIVTECQGKPKPAKI